MSNHEKILVLEPCSHRLAGAAECSTLREWWSTTTKMLDMVWLIGRAHAQGTLSRRRLIAVAVRCVETVAHMLPVSSLEHLATVSAWARGEDVTVGELRASVAALRAAEADDRAAYAAYAYVSACSAATATAEAAIEADIEAAINHFYIVAHATKPRTAKLCDTLAAICDVIRDEITIDEVCDALELNPDEGVTT